MGLDAKVLTCSLCFSCLLSALFILCLSSTTKCDVLPVNEAMFIIPIKNAFQFLACLIMSLNAQAPIKLDCMELPGCCQQYWFIFLSLSPSESLSPSPFLSICFSSTVTYLYRPSLVLFLSFPILLYMSITLYLSVSLCLFFSKPLVWIWPAGCCCHRGPGQELDQCGPSAEVCHLHVVWVQVSLSLKARF